MRPVGQPSFAGAKQAATTTDSALAPIAGGLAISATGKAILGWGGNGSTDTRPAKAVAFTVVANPDLSQVESLSGLASCSHISAPCAEDGSGRYPEVGLDASGNALFVWDSLTRLANNFCCRDRVWYAHRNAAGEYSGASPIDDRTQNEPHLGASPNGQALVASSPGDLASDPFPFDTGTVTGGTWATGGLTGTNPTTIYGEEHVAMAPSGTALVALADADGAKVWVYTPAKGMSEAHLLGGDHSAPVVAMGGNGSGIAAWASSDAGKPVVRWRALTATGQTLGATQTIQSASDPQVGMDGAGNAIVIYRTPYPYALKARYRPAGDTTAFGAEETVVDHGASQPALAVASSGGALAAWVDSFGELNASFREQPKPKPKPKPKCTIAVPSSKVTIPRPGTLKVLATCDQGTSMKLTGVLTAKPKKKKGATKAPKTQTFQLKSQTKAGKAKKATTFIIKLPKQALTLLASGAAESATLSLRASNVNGTGTANKSVPKIRAGKKKS